MHLHQERRSSRGKKISKGFLTIRLRGMVQQITKEERVSEPNPLFFGLNKSYHSVTKIIWSLFCIFCIFLFAYQSYDRISYYSTYPVAVDVYIKETITHKFPVLTICMEETEDSSKVFREIMDKKQKKSCSPATFTRFATSQPGYNASYLWQLANTSTAVKKARFMSKMRSINLTLSDIALHVGTCTSFSYGKIDTQIENGIYEVEFGRYLRYCDDNRSISLNARVVFVNRTHHPCISSKEYAKCRKLCFTNYLKSLNVTCRYPFYPKKLSAPTCHTGKRHSFTDLVHATGYLLGTAINITCNCIRQCYYRTFEYNIRALPSDNNLSMYVLRFQDSYETLIIERLSYDVIQMLCDIGGASGLTIGFSLLSIFQTLQATFNSMSKKKPLFQFGKNDPIFRIVSRTYKCWIQSTKRREIRPSLSKKWLIFARIICVVFLGFAVTNRLLYFLSNPVIKLVEVRFIEQMENPPMFIACGGNATITSMQRNVSKERNYTEFCDVHLWELIDFPGFDAKFIWDEHYRTPNANKATIYEGLCTYDDLISYGFTSPNLPVKSYRPVFMKLEPFCGLSYVKVYVVPPTRNIDYYNYLNLKLDARQEVMLNVKEIAVSESLRSSCVTEVENELCKNQCLYQQLFKEIKCRLPYMLEANVPLCNSSASAKQSHTSFIDLFLTPDGVRDCKCQPKCITTVYETRSFDAVNEDPMTTGKKYVDFELHLRGSAIITFREQYAYSLVKFLSDVGGWIGVTLGLSLLSLVELVIKIKYQSNLTKSITNSNT